MKLNSIAFTLAAAGSFVAASPSPHRHHHHHLEKKSVDTKVITVEKYELGGQPATLEEVCKALKSGKWATSNGAALPQCAENYEAPDGSDTGHGQPPPHDTSSTGQNQGSPPVVPSTKGKQSPPIVSDTESKQQPPAADPVVKNKQQPSPVDSGSKDNQKSPTVLSNANTQSTPTSSTASSGGPGLDRDFPDGEIDCSHFPSEYGPIPISWMDIGGWSGIQYVTIDGGAVTHIDTAVPGGPGCSGNAMCSYACPEGYQKSQWPATQGNKGQSVGGLQCNSNGKLALTNPGLSKKLCIQGTGSTKVQNNLGSTVAICRTDYPGTENEVVPLNTRPGTTHELTCPDSSRYFHHDGLQTTAHYYVNRKGISKESACIWGKDGTSQGNWAPTVFGVGKDSNGRTWLSIATTTQNNPTAYKPLDYTVTLEGQLGGKCRVQNGQYCWGDNYESCNESGCTVELLSGEAKYVLTN